MRVEVRGVVEGSADPVGLGSLGRRWGVGGGGGVGWGVGEEGGILGGGEEGARGSS